MSKKAKPNSKLQPSNAKETTPEKHPTRTTEELVRELIEITELLRFEHEEDGFIDCKRCLGVLEGKFAALQWVLCHVETLDGMPRLPWIMGKQSECSTCHIEA